MKKKEIVSQILSDISNGKHLPGEAFESVRSLGKKYGVSHMTAYDIICDLQDKGIIETRLKSKSRITSNLEILKSYKVKYSNLPIKVERDNLLPYLLGLENNPEIVNLGTAINMDEIVPSEKIMEKIGSKNLFFKRTLSQYSYPPGTVELRSQLAKLENQRGHDYSPEDFILTQGAMEGIGLSLNLLLTHKDRILIVSPCFYGIIHLTRQLGKKVVEVKIENKLPLSEIEKKLKNNPLIKVGIFQSNYNNPTGQSFSEQEKKKLVQLFRKYKRYIIEDDTYAWIGFDKRTTTNLATYDDKRDTVFSCSSFSKVIGPGINLGWITPPKAFIKKTTNYKISYSFSTQLSNESLVSHLLSKKSFFTSHTAKVAKIFKRNTDYTTRVLSEELHKGCKVVFPKGAFSVWIKMPNHVDSFSLYEELIREGISITPGYVYSTNDLYKNFLRINCATTFDERTKKALLKICETINRYL